MPASRSWWDEPGSIRRAVADGLRLVADRFAPAPPARTNEAQGMLVRLGGRWYPSARLLRDEPPGPQPPELG